MLPNTAMLKPMVNSALMIFVKRPNTVTLWKEPNTTKIELPTAMDTPPPKKEKKYVHEE